MDQIQDGDGEDLTPIKQTPAQSSFSEGAAERLYPDDQPKTPQESQAKKKAPEEVRYPDDVPKSEGEQKPEGEQKDQPSEVTAGGYRVLPETLPEGYSVDPVLLNEAAPVFRSLGLTNDQANRLMPLAIKVQERLVEQHNDEFDVLKADWARQARNDPRLGGANWKQTERLLSVALDAAGAGKGSEFRNLMDESGLGNHPAVIRAFRKIGEALSRKGTSGAPFKKDTAQILYPDD